MPDSLTVVAPLEREQAWFLRRGPTKERLLIAENTRLRRLCVQHEEIVARHDLAVREGDHRIKNSLQIVSGLIALQERRETNQDARAALRAAASRIHAIAQMHNALNLNGGGDSVDFGALVQSMCESVHAMAGDARRIVVEVSSVPVCLPIRLAQPLLLAVNELMINALRHAFPGERAGTVHVGVANVAGQLSVVVADNGVGLPDEYVKQGGYGLSLVKAMIRQIGASLTIESRLGARFTISPPQTRVREGRQRRDGSRHRGQLD